MLADSGNHVDPTQKIKIVVLGDAGIGKSLLLTTFTIPHRVNRTQTKQLFADYTTTITVDAKTFELSIWDTNSSKEYEHIRPLNFAHTAIFLLCFSITSPQSIDNIQLKWDQEIKKYFGTKDKEPAKLLVGLQSDLRELESSSFSSSSLREKGDKRCVSREQAMQLARDIGAVSYVECSSLTGDGIEDVFLAAVNAVIYPQLSASSTSTTSPANEDKDIILNPSPNTKKKRKGKGGKCIIS